VILCAFAFARKRGYAGLPDAYDQGDVRRLEIGVAVQRLSGGTGPPLTPVREPPTFLRQSSIGAVVIQFLEQRVEQEDRTTRDISAGTNQRRGQVALPDQLRESHIVHV
jgi:hypothetical protein